MRSRTLKIDDHPISKFAVSEAASVLMHGGLIGYPTETVYGIGCDAFNGRCVERIHEMKGRIDHQPFLVLVKNEETIERVVASVPMSGKVLMKAFWPGPLTIVLAASRSLPANITAGTGKVGIRVSPHPFCRALFERFDGPLVSTSANLAGHPPAVSVEQVIEYFSDELDLVMDGGFLESGTPSTIVDVTCDPPRFIREGGVEKRQIEDVLGLMHG